MSELINGILIGFIGMLIFILVIKFAPKPKIGTYTEEWNSNTTSYRAYVLYKNKFWVEADEYPEVGGKAGTKKLTFSKNETYVLIRCDLDKGQYDYYFLEKGIKRHYNDWKQFLKQKKLPFQDFPSDSVMDKRFPYMPQQRRKRHINVAIRMPSKKNIGATSGRP